MTKLPDSIEHMKHLRYLNLARTDLERLPEAVCTLYNLQFLILTGCSELVELPENMGNLINLHCLSIRGANKLQKMPAGIGDLKHLVILSDFILGKQSSSDLNELGKLQHLRGALSVSNLQNVVNIPNNILKNKRELVDLKLKWSGGSENSAHELSVLEQLQPYASIKNLSIDGYGGTKFADWVGLFSYTNLVSLELHGCENCFSLPPLGSLSYLEYLSISKFDAMVDVSMEMPFKSLKTLLITNMEQWEKWLFCEENNPRKCGSLEKLEKLTIQNCPKLKTILTSGPTHMVFCSLNSLKVAKCPDLKIYNLIAIFKPKITKPPHPPKRLFDFQTKPMVILEQLPSAMYRLSVVKNSTERIEEMGDALNALEDVQIRRSELCECIPLEVFPVLKSLCVEKCCNLKSLSVCGLPLPQPLMSLTSLKINKCESLTCFPERGISAPNLSSFELIRCKNLKSLPEGMDVLLPSLKLLKIQRCEKLESFPEGGLPTNLQSLIIERCKKVKSFPEGGLPTNLQSLVIERCKNLESFLEGGLPANLQTLYIAYYYKFNKLCGYKLTDRCWQWSLQTLHALSSLTLLYYGGDHLNCFQLLPALTSLEMSCCWNLKLVNFKNPQQLTHLSIKFCGNLENFRQGSSSTSAVETERVIETESVQQEGLLPSLQSLEVMGCDKLIGRRLQWDLQKFNALSHLTLGWYNKDDLGSFPEESLLPSTLTSLTIEEFENLEVINHEGLRHLTSLSKFVISGCRKLRCLPEGLPSSLSVLKIKCCDLLKERCQRGKGQDWPKIAHISTIVIN